MSVFSFTQNPIARAEMAIQQRPLSTSLVVRVVRYAFYTWLTVMAVGLIGVELVAAVTHANPPALIERLSPIIQIFLFLVTAAHFRLMFRTLAATVAAMERERRHDERWESLVMTGIPARAIVLGKWSALVRSGWREYAWLALWRAGAVIWLGASTSRSLMSYYSTNMSTSIDFSITRPAPLHFLLALLIIVTLTMLNLLFTTACGVYAGIAYKRGAIVAAILTRLLMIVCFSIGLVVILCQLSAFSVMRLNNDERTASDDYSLTMALSAATSWGLGSLYDNGATLAGATVSYGVTVEDMSPISAPSWVMLLTFVVVVGFYSVLTVIALFIGQAQAERFGALKAQEVKRK